MKHKVLSDTFLILCLKCYGHVFLRVQMHAYSRHFTAVQTQTQAIACGCSSLVSSPHLVAALSG